MTDEERQKLVARFRAHEVVMWTDIDLAADELERLSALPQSNSEPMVCPNCGASVWQNEAALAQSDTEPAAWRVKDFGDDWILCHSREWAERQAKSAGNLIQPLYTAPSRPRCRQE